jgi:hypothetical protein
MKVIILTEILSWISFLGLSQGKDHISCKLSIEKIIP